MMAFYTKPIYDPLMKTVKLIFIFLVIATVTFAQEKSVLLDSLFTTMHHRSQFNGNVIVAEKGEIIYDTCLGPADRESEIPLDDSTLFNTGSVSKVFTAIAIQQLAEENKLNYQDPVTTYLPGFPYADITIHHLLVHAGGLPEDYKLLKSKEWPDTLIATNEDVMAALYAHRPDLKFTPGEESAYSNLGYIVLAEIVEAVSGTDFKAYIYENIFGPAKMNRSGIYDREEIKEVKKVARGYLFYPFSGKYERAIDIPEFSSNYVVSGFEGDGNVYSTVRDLYKFYNALKSGVLISEKSLNEALKKHISGNDSYGTSFGYGWTIANAPVKLVQRGGELPGYVSNIIWNVSEDRVLIYLMNDYLAYISYQHQIYPAYAKIMHAQKLDIPKLKASIELTKIAVTSSLKEMEAKIKKIKNHPELYAIDVNGLKFLVHKLKSLDETEKAELLMKSFQPE